MRLGYTLKVSLLYFENFFVTGGTFDFWIGASMIGILHIIIYLIKQCIYMGSKRTKTGSNVRAIFSNSQSRISFQFPTSFAAAFAGAGVERGPDGQTHQVTTEQRHPGEAEAPSASSFSVPQSDYDDFLAWQWKEYQAYKRKQQK